MLDSNLFFYDRSIIWRISNSPSYAAPRTSPCTFMNCFPSSIASSFGFRHSFVSANGPYGYDQLFWQ